MSKNTVDEYVKSKVLPQHREIMAILRELMREIAPDAKERISYGIPVWKRNRIFAFIGSTKKDIVFSFTRGAQMADKYGLLKGSGKTSRHIRIKDPSVISKVALRYYIKQAIKLDST